MLAEKIKSSPLVLMGVGDMSIPQVPALTPGPYLQEKQFSSLWSSSLNACSNSTSLSDKI